MISMKECLIKSMDDSWGNLIEAYKNNRSIRAQVIRTTKGGLVVDVGGIEAYLPGSLLDTHAILPYYHYRYIGNIYDVKIVKLDRKKSSKKNVVVSRLAVLKGE